jgi:hypothetical protein
MNYLTNYYKNLCEQLQQQVNILQSQLDEYVMPPGVKDGQKGLLHGSTVVSDEERKAVDNNKYYPKLKSGENNLTPRPISDKDYNSVKDEIVKKAREKTKPKSNLPYSERAGEGEEDSSVPTPTPSNPTDRTKIDFSQFFKPNDDKNRVRYINSKVNNLDNGLNEANIRNPSDQLAAGRTTGGNNIFRLSAGYDRMNDMLHYQAAHAIAEPHEQEAIERVLTDMAGSGTGTLADMGHMRTAVGAVKRLKGTEAFAKSLSSVRAPIEQESLSRAKQNLYSLHNVNMKDVRAGDLTPREEEEMEDQVFDVSQQRILGSRKKK